MLKDLGRNKETQNDSEKETPSPLLYLVIYHFWIPLSLSYSRRLLYDYTQYMCRVWPSITWDTSSFCIPHRVKTIERKPKFIVWLLKSHKRLTRHSALHCCASEQSVVGSNCTHWITPRKQQKLICQDTYSTEHHFLGSAEFLGFRGSEYMFPKGHGCKEGLPISPSQPRGHYYVLSYTDAERKGPLKD